MASSLRRVRRDSETSTDSWSVVEQDRLDDDDDFSLHSSDDGESEVESCDSDCDSDCEQRKPQQQPIVEEPPTSDEEEEEEEVEEEESDVEVHEESDEDEEESEEEEEEVEEEEELSGEEEEEEEEGVKEDTLRMVKDEEWDDYYDDLLDQRQSNPMALRMMCFVLLFALVFPLADIVTNYVLGPEKEAAPPVRNIFGDVYSQQSYDADYVHRDASIAGGRSLRLLREFLTGEKAAVEEIRWFTKRRPTIYIPDDDEDEYDLEQELVASPVRHPATFFPNSTIVLPVSTFDKVFDKAIPEAKVCSAIAPIPPAPFTPRKKFTWNLPRHQPCYVFVNQSKWTCHPKSLFDVEVEVSKKVSTKDFYKKAMSKSTQIKKKNHEICAMKASQSMRHQKTTEQCDSRHFQKYVPRRKHIAFKTPVPCKALTYKPSTPKPARKPSTIEDWHSKRSHLRAKLRSRA